MGKAEQGDVGTKTIVALDPGGTTGITIWKDLGLGEQVWFNLHLGPDEHHKELADLLEREQTQDFTVVCESFEFRQGKQRAGIVLVSKEYIGVVKYLARERNFPVVFQTAGLAKGFVSDEKLKAMGLYQRGMRHANDATRHLVTYRVQRLHHNYLINDWKVL